MNIYEFEDFIESLEVNENIILDDYSLPLKAPNSMLKKAIDRQFPVELIDFYKKFNGFSFSWSAKKIKDPNVKGVMNILPLKEAMKDWSGVVYFEEDSESMKHFVPIDFFIDEACTGFYIGTYAEPTIYFYDFSETPTSLGLSFYEYLQLGLGARGFLYWQFIILELREDNKGIIFKRFKENMPLIFKGFNLQKFLDEYQKYQ